MLDDLVRVALGVRRMLQAPTKQVCGAGYKGVRNFPLSTSVGSASVTIRYGG